MSCEIKGCAKEAKNRRLCWTHYSRQRKYGDPLHQPAVLVGASDAERIRAYSRLDEASGCWLWTRSIYQGYGRVRSGGTWKPAHRVSYEAFLGPIPDGLHIDHLCRNPRCVNPNHLEPVTQAENTRRHFALQVSCANGHAYDGQNTGRTRRGWRYCRACNRERMQRATGYGPRTQRAHCKAGHPFDAKNTYVRKDGGGRQCKQCGLERRRAAS